MGKQIGDFYNLYVSKTSHAAGFYEFDCVGIALNLTEAKRWVSDDKEHRKYKHNSGVIIGDIN